MGGAPTKHPQTHEMGPILHNYKQGKTEFN